jgi:hypothetical protein
VTFPHLLGECLCGRHGDVLSEAVRTDLLGETPVKRGWIVSSIIRNLVPLSGTCRV